MNFDKNLQTIYTIKTDRCTLIPLIYPKTLEGYHIENSQIVPTSEINNHNDSHLLEMPEMIDNSAKYTHELWLVLHEESTRKGCGADHSDEEATIKWLASKKRRFVYSWVVTNTETDNVMGFVTLWPYNLTINERIFSISGGGAEAFRRRHFGKEVLNSIIKFAHNNLGATLITTSTFTWNYASQKLQESVGFKQICDQNGTPIVKKLNESVIINYEMSF